MLALRPLLGEVRVRQRDLQALMDVLVRLARGYRVRRRRVAAWSPSERPRVIDRPNGSRPGRQSGSGLVVRKGSPSAPPISLPTARAGGVKGLKAVGFLAKPTLDAAEHAGTARMLPGYGSSRVTRT